MTNISDAEQIIHNIKYVIEHGNYDEFIENIKD